LSRLNAASDPQAPLAWEQILLPRDGFKEGSLETNEEGGDAARFATLDSKNAPCITVTSEELQAKWIDACIEQSRPKDMDLFSLPAVLPMLLREDSMVTLVNKTAEGIPSEEVYVTEQELRRLWAEASLTSMGKSLSKFDVQEALLLLPDEEADLLMGDGEAERAMADSLIKTTKKIAVDGELEEMIFDSQEYFITIQELQRVWDERAQIPWGMPAKSFDEKLALLQLDEDDDEDGEDVYVSCLSTTGLDGDALMGDEEGTGEEENDEGNYWNKYPGEEDLELRNLLRKLNDELEDKTRLRPAWKKDRHILTPDIDTQNFVGDIMNSNTYMTPRVPANWNDPELEEMSETYLSTGTMAWPDEEETDFNAQLPLWEQLNLPVAALFGEEEATMTEEEQRQQRSSEKSAKKKHQGKQEDREWFKFDFAAPPSSEPLSPILQKLVSTDFCPYLDESDDFSSDSSTTSSSSSSSSEQIDVNSFFNKIEKGSAAAASDDDDDEVALLPLTPGQDPPKEPKFVTPVEWYQNEEFQDHVGAETYLGYTKDLYAFDDQWWDEDVYLAYALEHVERVTDEYLTDHTKVTAALDDVKYWERELRSKLTGENATLEEIPYHLTPDKDRGVEYTMDVIEMKSKMTLEAYLPPPAKLWETDVFTHNTDVETMNKIGTIRDQYDWHPRSNASWAIDESIKQKIKPVLDYINYGAELKSTAGNVLVFDYFGHMRHLIGIRSSMIAIAKECFPEMVELHLETERTSDKFDGGS